MEEKVIENIEKKLDFIALSVNSLEVKFQATATNPF